jgi:2-polyprenyl-6-methoxyphenol hydroxylase-like FAD-dependent oxidoreductase
MAPASEPQTGGEALRSVEQTTCCVVGAGPAGAVLALLLARRDVPVLLLESHKDFERDFRGDTIHPSTMEIMEELGLAERLLALPHSKLRSISVQTADGPFRPVDFTRLRTRYPYITMMPQARFLEFLTADAARCPSFRLVLGADVRDLVEEDGVVRGVRYRADDGWHEVRALLTVAADGRFSRVRHLAGLRPVKTSPPMDVLWFRLPRRPGDPEENLAFTGRGHLLGFLLRPGEWQVAYVIPKGGYQEVRAAGLEELRRSIATIVSRDGQADMSGRPDEQTPAAGAAVDWIPGRLAELKDWRQIAVLSVESSRLRRWYRPGLLLIGDAAHVMSPVGGVGINYAVQDAVEAANVLTGPLREGRVRLQNLAEVQHRREWPTRFIQGVQELAQRRVVARVLRSRQALRVPGWVRFLMRLPLLRDLPGRIIAFGLWRVHVTK